MIVSSITGIINAAYSYGITLDYDQVVWSDDEMDIVVTFDDEVDMKLFKICSTDLRCPNYWGDIRFKCKVKGI